MEDYIAWRVGQIFARLPGGKVGIPRKAFLDEWNNKSKDPNSNSTEYLERNDG